MLLLALQSFYHSLELSDHREVLLCFASSNISKMPEDVSQLILTNNYSKDHLATSEVTLVTSF